MADKQHSQDASDDATRPESKSEHAGRKAEDLQRGEVNKSAESYNEKAKACKNEQKVSGRSRATGAGADAYGKGGLASAKDLLGDMAHQTLTKDSEKNCMSAARQAELMEKIKRDGYIVGQANEDQVPKGSAEDTGTVTDYKPRKNNEHFYSAGMNYEDGKVDTRNFSEKLGDFASAAAIRASDPKGWQTWFDGQVQKVIGIGEGLNEAKEETKAAVAAGCKALTDGTVSNFLAKPNAINDPLFKAVSNVFDAVSTDPNATNKALEALGNAVIKSSNDYSVMSKEDQGKVIGKTMFAMVNPEGSTEAAEVALKVADRVATSVDKAVMDTIAVSMKAAEKTVGQSPEMMQQAKQRLLDYLNSKELLGQGLEYAGVPEGYFDGMQPTRNAAKENYMAMSGSDDASRAGRKKISARESASEKPLPSEQFSKNLAKCIETLDAEELEFLSDNAIEIIPVRRISEWVPGKEKLGACYSPEHRAILVPEEILCFGEYVPNNDVPFALRHEFGHVLNAKSPEAVLNGHYISDKQNFIDAYNRDFARLSREQIRELELESHGKVGARDEVFADMYAHVTHPDGSNNAYSQKLRKAFPDFYKEMEDLLND